MQRRSKNVVHPVTGVQMGSMMLRLGRVRVLCAQDDVATGVIMDSCDPILESDELFPWKDIPVPNVTTMPPFDRYCNAPSGGPQGYVVVIKDGVPFALELKTETGKLSRDQARVLRELQAVGVDAGVAYGLDEAAIRWLEDRGILRGRAALRRADGQRPRPGPLPRTWNFGVPSRPKFHH